MGGIPNMLPTKIPHRGHISSRFDDTSVSSASCGATQETSAESKSRCFHRFWAKTRSSSNETLQLLAERISSWRRHPHVLLFLGCSANYEFCRGAAVKRLSENIQDSKMQYLHFWHVLHNHCLECYSSRARWELRSKALRWVTQLQWWRGRYAFNMHRRTTPQNGMRETQTAGSFFRVRIRRFHRSRIHRRHSRSGGAFCTRPAPPPPECDGTQKAMLNNSFGAEAVAYCVEVPAR